MGNLLSFVVASPSNQQRLLSDIFNLKLNSRMLLNQARRCGKQHETEKLNVKKAIEKGDVEGARLLAETAIRKQTEQLNYQRLSNRLDAVVSRLETQSKMTSVSMSMAGIVSSLEASLNTGDMVKLSETMSKFEDQTESMDVSCAHMQTVMASGTALSTPQDKVDLMLQQIGEAHQLDVTMALSSPALQNSTIKEAERTTGDSLARAQAGLRLK